MINCPMRIRLSGGFAAAFIVIFAAGLRAAPIDTPWSHGYHVVITNAQWVNTSLSETDLHFNFSILKIDGSPVLPNGKSGSVSVAGWTPDDIDPGGYHSAIATASSDSQGWQAFVPDLDPRCSTAHVQIEMQEPSAPIQQTGSATSDMEFDSVPVPTAYDVEVPLNYQFVTPLGTIIKWKA